MFHWPKWGPKKDVAAAVACDLPVATWQYCGLFADFFATYAVQNMSDWPNSGKSADDELFWIALM